MRASKRNVSDIRNGQALRVGIVFDSGNVSCKDAFDSISDAGVMDEVNAVRHSLRKLGHKAVLIQVGRRFRKSRKVDACHLHSQIDIKRIIESLVSDLRKARGDAVLNLCETFCGNAKLQTVVTRILDEMRIPYTGSPGNAIDLTTDKTRTKEVLEGTGIPTPRFRIFRSGKEVRT